MYNPIEITSVIKRIAMAVTFGIVWFPHFPYLSSIFCLKVYSFTRISLCWWNHLKRVDERNPAPGRWSHYYNPILQSVSYGYGSTPFTPNTKMAAKWMFLPLKKNAIDKHWSKAIVTITYQLANWCRILSIHSMTGCLKWFKYKKNISVGVGSSFSYFPIGASQHPRLPNSRIRHQTQRFLGDWERFTRFVQEKIYRK